MKSIKQLMPVLLLLTCIGAYATSPTITGFSPASGPVGTLVTITGTNLSSPTAFTVGGVPAIVVSNTGTTLVGMVMPGAATGSVSITTSGGTATGSSHFTITRTPYPTTQQGSKLVGTGAIWGSNGDLGSSVSLSADGNTAMVGGEYNDSNAGAAWVYIRTDTAWAQQGSKLVGTGAINGTSGTSSGAQQGGAVSLSADGNTALVGGWNDNNQTGATWVYTRSGTAWTQQGGKLIGTGAINSPFPANQGTSVSLSADGNTALEGGWADSSGVGAVWVFIRTGTTWTQQGNKLVGTGAIDSPSASSQGTCVSLSADGNTALVGGRYDNSGAGAAWVFTRSGGTWSQQGKLVGTGAVNGSNGANQGQSVSLSADGNTAIVGGWQDNSNAGAAWVFTRSGGTWSQQGLKLVGMGATGAAGQGGSVSLSADGNTAIVGGSGDNSGVGATWVFTRSGATWTQQGGKLIGTGAIAGLALQGGAVSLSADGSTAIEGGMYASGSGAAWVFVSCNTTAYFTLSPTNIPHHWDIVNLCTGNDLSYLWNWGDGTANSTGDTPSHTYSAAGYYNVCVNVTDTFGCIASYCDTNVYLFKDQSGQMVYVNVLQYPLGINSISGTSTIHLYPNPNTGTFTLRTTPMQNATYTISDMMGQMIKQDNITSDSQLIDIGSLSTGIYMLSIAGTSEIVKFEVMR